MPLIHCPLCQQKIDAPEEALGKQVECPGCDKGFNAPSAKQLADEAKKLANEKREAELKAHKANREADKERMRQEEKYKLGLLRVAQHASPFKRPSSKWTLIFLVMAILATFFGVPAFAVAGFTGLVLSFWLVETLDTIIDAQLDSNDLQLRIIELLEKDKKTD